MKARTYEEVLQGIEEARRKTIFATPLPQCPACMEYRQHSQWEFSLHDSKFIMVNPGLGAKA